MSSATAHKALDEISLLRWLVAFLGGGKEANWWDCTFLNRTGISYLENTFPRSAHSAALHATIEAAQRVHDEALGRIGSFHLFRLPVLIEDRLLEIEAPNRLPESKESALAELSALADALIVAPEGPVQIGIEDRILTPTSIKELAAHYHSAFSQGIRCYPYFSKSAG